MVAIPIRLLWNLQIKRRQKIGLGVFLCLNLSMAIIAFIRSASIRSDAVWDTSWILFWQHIEACNAVIMVSLTAFRSFFVSGVSSTRRARRAREWYSPSFTGRRRPKDDLLRREIDMPTIPSATLTGMRTFLRGDSEASDVGFDEVAEHRTIRMKGKDHGTEVAMTYTPLLNYHGSRLPQKLSNIL